MNVTTALSGKTKNLKSTTYLQEFEFYIIELNVKMAVLLIKGVLFLILVKLSLVSLGRTGEYAMAARRLYDKVLMQNGYNKLVRPAPRHNETVEVYLSVKLSALMDVVCFSRTKLSRYYLVFF